MQRRDWTRWAPLLGTLSIVLFIVAFAVGGETPDFDVSGREVIDFYSSNDTSQIICSILLSYASLFLVFFGAVFAGRFRAAMPNTSVLPGLVLAGAVLMAVGFLIFAGLTFTLADLGDDAEAGAAQALNALNGDLFFPVAVGTGVFALSASIALLRSALLPRWLGWIGVVIGVLAVTPLGFVALLAAGIWILVVSLTLTRQTAPGPAIP